MVEITKVEEDHLIVKKPWQHWNETCKRVRC